MSSNWKQEIKFKIDYVLPGSSREFGTVYLGGDKNIAGLVVAQGFAKVCYFGEVAIFCFMCHIDSKFLWSLIR